MAENDGEDDDEEDEDGVESGARNGVGDCEGEVYRTVSVDKDGRVGGERAGKSYKL